VRDPRRTVHVEEKGMRHIKSVARPRDIKRIPGRAQTTTTPTTPLGVKMEFLVNLTDAIITIIMHAASGL